MLTIFRRHLDKCTRGRKKGRECKDCSCPIAVEGKLDGVMIRRTLDRRDWKAAQILVRQWEAYGVKNMISLSDAYDRFITQHKANNSAEATINKHLRMKKNAVDFFGDVPVRGITVDEVSRFRESWKFAPLTTRNTIERFRAFFNFCIARDWIEKNPAKSLKLPKIEEVPVKPYTDEEMKAIMRAIEDYPNWGIYKSKTRERVRAFILTLRWTGMRIGDACQLSKEKVGDGRIILRTTKNGKRVSVPMHPDLEIALEAVESGEFYFWSGNGKVSSVVSDWHRAIERLGKDLPFRMHSHRFRHTFAAELISAGISIPQVAAILGNTPSVVEKIYAQHIEQRQKAIDEAVASVWK